MRVLVFDIEGDYAHFRKFYTTTSPLTFSFPPPSTIAGILGAIYGCDKNEYLSDFGSDKCRIGLQILAPIKKVRMGINLLETRGRNLKLPMSDPNYAPRTQIRTEFVKAPRYRIYIAHQDPKIFDALSENIKCHKSFYTVSLGLSELLADFRFVNIYEADESHDEITELSTPITANNLHKDGLEIEEGKRYFKEKMPLVMNQERIVENYDDVIFEPEGKTIKAIAKTYYNLESGENIVFF